MKETHPGAEQIGASSVGPVDLDNIVPARFTVDAAPTELAVGGMRVAIEI